MIDEPARRLDEGALRVLVPRVLAGLVRRGEDFDAAEDALQEALLEALRVWPEHPPDDPRAWLATVATRRLVDARRSEAARHRREEATSAEPQPVSSDEVGDDTLFLLFCCCHPDLAPASQVALTLRAVGGLTTREIADAFYVPEASMAQRISRAKRALAGPPARQLDQPGDLAVVLRVLYLIYTAGHTGRVDLAGEAIRLARQLTLAIGEPEARGLLALMPLNHARLPARLDSKGRIVTLDRQDRGLWDTREIADLAASSSEPTSSTRSRSAPESGSTASRPPTSATARSSRDRSRSSSPSIRLWLSLAASRAPPSRATVGCAPRSTGSTRPRSMSASTPSRASRASIPPRPRQRPVAPPTLRCAPVACKTRSAI